MGIGESCGSLGTEMVLFFTFDIARHTRLILYKPGKSLTGLFV